jgi:hypothetical protein
MQEYRATEGASRGRRARAGTSLRPSPSPACIAGRGPAVLSKCCGNIWAKVTTSVRARRGRDARAVRGESKGSCFLNACLFTRFRPTTRVHIRIATLRLRSRFLLHPGRSSDNPGRRKRERSRSVAIRICTRVVGRKRVRLRAYISESQRCGCARASFFPGCPRTDRDVQT